MTESVLRPGDHPIDDIRKKTIVFALPPLIHLTPLDFLPHLSKFANICRFEAFGTVGVGHMLHLTVDDAKAAKNIVQYGDFSIGSVPAKVSWMDLVTFTAFIHWIPYWVPDADVEKALDSLLHDSYRCSYIRIDQPGFQGCYSTQRRIKSVGDLRGFPHFITVRSAGINYRAFVFVPGREPVCFKCGETGHMKDKCVAQGTVQHIPAQNEHPIQVVPPEVQSDGQTNGDSQMMADRPCDVDSDSENDSFQIELPFDSNRSDDQTHVLAPWPRLEEG